MSKTAKVIALIALSTSLLIFSLSTGMGSDKPAAVFEGKDTLLRPEGYREWIFVGSSLGLSYAKNSDSAPSRNPERFHNVYINPSAYREYASTGKFPEGTMMVLELASSEVKKEPGLQGLYEKEFVALEVSVKDSSRFDGGWGYFDFTDHGGKRKAKARAFPKESCWSCHHERAATDHVFTQFYPVLRAVSSK